MYPILTGNEFISEICNNGLNNTFIPHRNVVVMLYVVLTLYVVLNDVVCCLDIVRLFDVVCNIDVI